MRTCPRCGEKHSMYRACLAVRQRKPKPKPRPKPSRWPPIPSAEVETRVEEMAREHIGGMTMVEIAAVHGISLARVEQLFVQVGYRPRLKPPKPTTEVPCAYCTRPFVNRDGRQGTPPKFCSSDCARAMRLLRAAARRAATRAARQRRFGCV